MSWIIVLLFISTASAGIPSSSTCTMCIRVENHNLTESVFQRIKSSIESKLKFSNKPPTIIIVNYRLTTELYILSKIIIPHSTSTLILRYFDLQIVELRTRSKFLLVVKLHLPAPASSTMCNTRVYIFYHFQGAGKWTRLRKLKIL